MVLLDLNVLAKLYKGEPEGFIAPIDSNVYSITYQLVAYVIINADEIVGLHV